MAGARTASVHCCSEGQRTFLQPYPQRARTAARASISRPALVHLRITCGWTRFERELHRRICPDRRPPRPRWAAEWRA